MRRLIDALTMQRGPMGSHASQNTTTLVALGIIVVILLLLSMYEKIKFIPYQWWMVLILGFILYGWVIPAGVSGGTGGTIVLISFILMLLEK